MGWATMAASASSPLDSGPALRQYVRALALPAVGEQLLNTAVGLADVYMVGNLSQQAAAQLGYSSAVALTSTGLGNQMSWVLNILFMSVAIGSTALIARTTGAGNLADRQQYLRQSMIIGLVIGLLATLLVWFLGYFFLLAIGAAPDVLIIGETYMRIIALTLIPTALLFVGMACFRGAGDTRTPLYVMLGVNGINILITWLLVDGQFGLPPMGVNGAAIGTMIARGGGGCVIIALLLYGRSGLQLLPDLRPDFSIIRRILHIGLPTAGEQAVFHGALLLFTGLITGLGTVAYAAHFAVINIESLSFLPGLGYAAAAGALVGQALGAQSPQRARALAYEAVWQGGTMMVITGLVMFFFPGPLIAIFTNDPAVIAAGTAPLQAAGLVQFALALSFILNGALRGAGDTRWPMYNRIIGTWCFRLPLALLFVHSLGMGLNGIWLAMCTDFTLQASLSLWRFESGRWQHIEV
ncbi:MAG: MATE family efflux transporter [Chloroflexaceae bacterium]|nr:MATE family efflux transporter [Chloroflexaceae bacterium]